MYGFGPEPGLSGISLVQISSYLENSLCMSRVKVRIWFHILSLHIWFRARTWISRIDLSSDFRICRKFSMCESD